MKLWSVLILLLLAPACSGSRQEQREGETANHFSEHRWGDHATAADPHVARTSTTGSEQDSWISNLLGGVWDVLFNSDSSDTSNTLGL